MHKIVFPEFPFYINVYETVEDGTVKVIVRSSIHVNREVTMPNSWTEEFRRDMPDRFLADVRSFIIKRYGLTKEPTRYI